MMKSPIRGALSKDEFKHLNPDDKERYAGNLISGVLRKNREPLSISDLEDMTQLNRSTIEKHLGRLISLQIVERQVTGITARYMLVTRPSTEKELDFHSSGDTFYSLQMLQRDQTEMVYIQQKSLDELRSVVVKGGITIALADVPAFLKELQVYAIAQANKIEPSK